MGLGLLRVGFLPEELLRRASESRVYAKEGWQCLWNLNLARRGAYRV